MLLCALVWPSAGKGEESAPNATATTAKTIDFRRDIEPILKQHCWKCHGEEKRSGGLRLDGRMFAEAGGDSGKSILDSTPERNELYQRVSSSDRTYRMPKNAAPLPAEDLEKIRQWVEEGCAWPGGEAKISQSEQGYLERIIFSWAKFADRHTYEYERARPMAVVFILVQLALLLAARARAASQSGHPWQRPGLRSICRLCGNLSGRELTAFWLLSLAGLAIEIIVIHQQKLEAQIAELRTYRTMNESRWSKTIFGVPPVPPRPAHPKQVAVTYYRGNCERNPELFNGGNYLTATFRVSVCGKDHQELEVGDAVPQGETFVRMDLERGPGTTDTLFSPELMSSVFLSEQFYDAQEESLRDTPMRLETAEPGRRWVAFIPIGSLLEKATLKGLIYVYTGRIDGEKVRGEPHYAIKYDLASADGRLTDDSDLWMNSFGNGAVALPEPDGKIPYREWFDYRPIPPIVGENTKDPKLLGVEEYVRKGLIKAPAAKSNQQDNADDAK